MSKSAGKSNKKLSGEVTRRTPEVDRKKGDIKKAGGIKKTAEMVPWEWSHTVAFWGLAVLLFFSNYFKALYFPAQQERALIFAAIVFWFAWLWQWSQQDNGFLNSPLDYFALAFPAVYLISAFQAANYGLAVDEAVKATLCFMVYLAASRLVRNERDIVTVLNVIYMSAIGVALAGLAAATNIIHINRGFLDGRICSVFQYPNTLASYLLAVALIGLYLWRRAAAVETSKHIIQYLYAAANFLILAVFIGTKSQGGFLVFLFVFILFFIVIPKVDRAPVFIHFVTCCLFSALTMWGFLHAAAGGKTGLAWLWILLGLICAPAAHLLYNFGASKGLSHWIAGHKKIVLAAFLLFVVICLAGAAVYAAGHGDMVRAGIEKIRLRNAAERMYFYHDALKMFRERPILGWGGGGWDEAYRAYQSYFYNSDKVHGYYFQVLVETGIVGLLALLAVWAGFLHLTHRLYHQAKTNYAGRFLISVITVSAVSLGLHAAIDFDLSLSALALVLWTMFGLARGAGIYSGAGAAGKKSGKHVAPRYVAPAGVLAALILVIACAASLALAGNYSARVGTRVQSQNVNQS
ncbi:MAG: O-antigen ligase family protein, partial [Peptococcaceae bacterium]|nr:O-antigen ligase family protein [Peptococcaceae bacterium]